MIHGTETIFYYKAGNFRLFVIPTITLVKTSDCFTAYLSWLFWQWGYTWIWNYE